MNNNCISARKQMIVTIAARDIESPERETIVLYHLVSNRSLSSMALESYKYPKVSSGCSTSIHLLSCLFQTILYIYLIANDPAQLSTTRRYRARPSSAQHSGGRTCHQRFVPSPSLHVQRLRSFVRYHVGAPAPLMPALRSVFQYQVSPGSVGTRCQGVLCAESVDR